MNIDNVKQIIDSQDGLSRTLGMEFISTPEPDTCMARMKVCGCNRQPFGYLSGGATLALAENLAGVGSMALSVGKRCAGISVSGNHVKSVVDGDTVTAKARCVHKGRTLHHWHIDVFNNEGDIVSSVEVTNFIFNPRT